MGGRTLLVEGGRRCAFVVLLVIAAAGHAQEPDTIPVRPIPEEAPAETKPVSATVLSDIVVTSNKQEQVLRDIPASITVISGSDLEALGAQGIDDFLKLVPGVNIIPNEPGAVKVTIRGISSELGTNATSGTLFGNISFNDAYFPFVSMDPNPYDLYDIEVLKGPQGTLYGASALNGAVRYVPNRPQLDTFDFKYFAQYTQVNEGGGAPIYGGVANIPIGSDMALRLVGHDRRSPGYTDDVGRGLQDVNEISQSGFRGMYEWKPLQRWNVSATYMRQQTDFADDAFADNRNGQLSRDNTPRANPKSSFYDLADAALGYDFEWASLTLETALVRKRFTEQPDISRLVNGEASTSTINTTIFFNSDTRSAELRLASPTAAGGPWSWVGGGFWSDQPIDSGFDIYQSADQQNLGHQRSDVTVVERAVFLDVTREFWKDWQLSLGARAYNTTSGGIARASGAFYGGSENVNEAELAEHGVNPKASLRWQANEQLQVYTLVSRGFRVGGIQPTASALSTSIPKTFKSDTIWNYEVGVRTQWLENTLRADLTGFHEDWNEPQLAQRDPNNPNPVATYYDNVGGARSDGLELALQWHTPLDGLSATLAGAYVRTETTEPFTTGAGVATQPGTTWPYAPRWQTATVLAYVQPLWAAWDLRTAVTHTWTSKAYTTLAHDISVFDFEQLDLRVGLVDNTSKWPEVSFGLTNLLDVRGINQETKTGPAEDVTYVRPRAITLRLGGSF